ncbi:MAG: hypothetical protein IKX66_00020, partial [Clostridia bacterium]|nr:hypothetical protein [Clostridia bacterium]
MNKLTKGRGLALLLILATLIALTAVILPIVASATPDPELPEIGDFGVQQLTDLNLADADKTDLRFVYTIGKKEYDEVGFVFSKSNPVPTINGDKCYKKDVGTVYHTITADHTPVEAGAGRYWVAVKMNDVPHAYFDGALYVRAFVIDGEGTRYSSAKAFTVCSVDGHTHVIENEDLTETVDAALDHPSARIGHCNGCNLDNVAQYGETADLEFKKWVGGGTPDNWIEQHQMSSVLPVGQHFYPDASNSMQGNDLLLEYSILWNESLLNFSNTVNDGARITSGFATAQNGTSGLKSFAYMGLTNDGIDACAKFAGAFEYPDPLIKTSEAGNPSPNMVKAEQAYSAYPNIGGNDPDHPEWGWHRIGIRFHEEVTNLDDLKKDATPGATDPEYCLTVSIYIDGVLKSVLSGEDFNYTLYTAESDGADGVTYEDIDGNVWLMVFRIKGYQASLYDAYFIDGDIRVTCGHDFAYPVTRIDNPAARTETVDNKNFVAPFYYTTVGDHAHVWGELENDASASADCGHAATKSVHCTICGVTADATTVNLALDPDRHVYGAYKTYQMPSAVLASGDGVERRVCVNCDVHQDRAGAASSTATAIWSGTFDDSDSTQLADRKLLSEIQTGTHFYPTPANPDGKDLLVEYSILWNHTLLNLNTSANPYITTRLASWSGSNDDNLVWWSPTNDIDSSWCQYAGGFEVGALQSIAPAGAAYTPAGMCAEEGGYNAYPNIGGAIQADAGDLTNGHEWGWHHVQVRFHQEVSNVDAVKGGAPAEYEFVVTTYIDGEPISMLKSSNEHTIKADNYLFTAKYDSKDGIKYFDNSNLRGNDDVKRTVWGYKLQTK